MCVLIGNIVKTETADYTCRTRDEAEALYLALKSGRLSEPEVQRQHSARQEQREPAEVE